MKQRLFTALIALTLLTVLSALVVSIINDAAEVECEKQRREYRKAWSAYATTVPPVAPCDRAAPSDYEWDKGFLTQ